MAQPKQILFLCTGNYYRSRFAELLFNSVAGKMGLPWKAASRGLALERGAGNVGPIASDAIRALEKLGLRADAEWTRFPVQVLSDDLDNATLVIALKRTEHLPLVEERFPAWADEIEYWQIDDAPGALALIEREVMDLTARLIGGGKRPSEPSQEACPRCGQPTAACVCEKKQEKPKSLGSVRVGRATKGRRGKGVTIVSDLPLDEASLLELAAHLKNRCGTGGTVKDGQIEIQGDQRDRVTAELESMGYRVKRVGG